MIGCGRDDGTPTPEPLEARERGAPTDTGLAPTRCDHYDRCDRCDRATASAAGVHACKFGDECRRGARAPSLRADARPPRGGTAASRSEGTRGDPGMVGLPTDRVDGRDAGDRPGQQEISRHVAASRSFAVVDRRVAGGRGRPLHAAMVGGEGGLGGAAGAHRARHPVADPDRVGAPGVDGNGLVHGVLRRPQGVLRPLRRPLGRASSPDDRVQRVRDPSRRPCERRGRGHLHGLVARGRLRPPGAREGPPVAARDEEAALRRAQRTHDAHRRDRSRRPPRGVDGADLAPRRRSGSEALVGVGVEPGALGVAAGPAGSLRSARADSRGGVRLAGVRGPVRRSDRRPRRRRGRRRGGAPAS